MDSSDLMFKERYTNVDKSIEERKMLRWCDCNFIGVDLGVFGVRFSQGIAHRWNLQGRLQYVVDSAETFLQNLHSYQGDIICCMIQFPTPFRLERTENNKG